MDTVIIKRVILFTLLLFVVHKGFSQFATIVDIGSVDDKTVKTRMDENAGKLLTVINTSFANGTVPSLAGIDMTPDAKSAVLAIWETSPFRCKETELIDDILKLHSGEMELRNIRLYMKEADSSDKNQEGVLVFTKAGTIDNLYLAIENKQWKKVMSEGNGVTDLRRREIILNFVENFRTAYNRKDIVFLKNVFSEDALIITGKVIKVKVTDGDYMSQNFPKEKIIYNRQTKSEYMASMQRIFANNSYINIKFEELQVVQHKKYPDYYGVTIKQYWNTTKYSDVGYVFLLIDFTNEENPLIHVRTWQPSMINGREITKSEVFNIGSFGKLQ
jgi:hypothetical protein